MTRQVSKNLVYRALTLQDGDGNAAEFSARTAKAIEFWINVTALGTSGDYDFNFDTAAFDLGGGASTVWKTQNTLNVTATGLYCVTLNRIDHSLGLISRLSWTKNTTSITFDVKTVVLE